MAPNKPYPPAPEGGLCNPDNAHLFVDATTEEEIIAGKRICNQCPILTACHQWARKCIRLDNRGRAEAGLPPRMPLQGVVAGVHYTPTDQRGRAAGPAE